MPCQQNRSGRSNFAIGLAIVLVLFASIGARAVEAEKESKVECTYCANCRDVLR